MNLHEATVAYQEYLETYRQHSERFDDEQLELLEEDLNKAKAAMEIAWIKTIKTRS